MTEANPQPGEIIGRHRVFAYDQFGHIVSENLEFEFAPFLPQPTAKEPRKPRHAPPTRPLKQQS